MRHRKEHTQTETDGGHRKALIKCLLAAFTIGAPIGIYLIWLLAKTGIITW